MAIKASRSLEGLPLSSKQVERLQFMIDAIEKVNPARAPKSIVLQAVGSFKKTAQIVNGRWKDRDKFYLSNGRGPVVIPSWSSIIDVQ